MLGGYPIFRQSLILRGYSLKFKAYVDFADLFSPKNSTFGRSNGIANSIPCDQEMQLRQDRLDASDKDWLVIVYLTARFSFTEHLQDPYFIIFQ